MTSAFLAVRLQGICRANFNTLSASGHPIKFLKFLRKYH
jgi:hypothetical protein